MKKKAVKIFTILSAALTILFIVLAYAITPNRFFSAQMVTYAISGLMVVAFIHAACVVTVGIIHRHYFTAVITALLVFSLPALMLLMYFDSSMRAWGGILHLTTPAVFVGIFILAVVTLIRKKRDFAALLFLVDANLIITTLAIIRYAAR